MGQAQQGGELTVPALPVCREQLRQDQAAFLIVLVGLASIHLQKARAGSATELSLLTLVQGHSGSSELDRGLVCAPSVHGASRLFLITKYSLASLRMPCLEVALWLTCDPCYLRVRFYSHGHQENP